MVEVRIGETVIHRDAEGRYSFNDLHRASGKVTKNRPNAWLSSIQAQTLIDELIGPSMRFGRENRPLRVNHGAPTPGPYGSLALALAYALWISPAFHQKAKQALATTPQEDDMPALIPAEPALTVADIGIRKDAEGRLCLNDLHRAAGGERKHGPSHWLANAQTQDLVAELADTGNPVSVVKGGVQQGTYVCKELVYGYAMWISPAFHIKVIRAYDAMVTGQVVNPAQMSRLQLLELAMQAEKERAALVLKLDEVEPKAQALDLLATADGALCLSNAAKVVGMQPKAFIAWLHEIGWVFRRHGSSTWMAYQDKIKTGYLTVKIFTIEQADGTAKTREQALVTPKGMARLADLVKKAS